MAKNDKILIDGIIDERIESKFPSEHKGEVFELFSIEQILKEYDLSNDEIFTGMVDGRDDGGIDGFYIFVNGHLLSEPKTFNWPKSGSVLEIHIITSKHHSTYKQAPLDNITASLSELFDLSLDDEQLKGDYSDDIIRLRNNLKTAYKKLSTGLSKFAIHFYYSSRGDTTDLGRSIISRGKQIEQIALDYFRDCESKFNFYGASELIQLYRKIPNFTLELPFVENLSRGERYILLVNLKDYYKFITDNDKLKRYLFDSNVRDYMGLNRTNKDIKLTLINTDSPDFWLLNNGVTILATGARVIGKTIQIEDIQIVNGLQTSESIYQYFNSNGNDPNFRSVLVKVIVTSDTNVRDLIIRATNNQTDVGLASLHATDKIQRDIEDICKKNEFYYERRINYYKNQGFPNELLISPLYIASGYVSLVLKMPHKASNLKTKFMKSKDGYERVFNTRSDINVWPKIAYILKTTDNFLENVRHSQSISNAGFLKRNRQYVSFLAIVRITNDFNFSIADIINLKKSDYTSNILQESWEIVCSSYNQIKPRPFKFSFLARLCRKAEEEWDAKNIGRVLYSIKPKLNYNEIEKSISSEKKIEFSNKLYKILPPQPWKRGTTNEMIAQLDCSKSQFYSALNYLINKGLIYKQINGKLYNNKGLLVEVDVINK